MEYFDLLKSINGIELNNQQIDYLAKALVKVNRDKDDVLDYMLKTPFPVQVTGSVSNPQIHPKMDNYIKNALQNMQKNFLKKAAEKVIQKVLGGSSEEGAENDPLKSLGKQLEGIFKR